eukprot:1195664-Prorocentrum_minimum.AAC.11
MRIYPHFMRLIGHVVGIGPSERDMWMKSAARLRKKARRLPPPGPPPVARRLPPPRPPPGGPLGRTTVGCTSFPLVPAMGAESTHVIPPSALRCTVEYCQWHSGTVGIPGEKPRVRSRLALQTGARRRPSTFYLHEISTLY